jgi:hypothetical protein
MWHILPSVPIPQKEFVFLALIIQQMVGLLTDLPIFPFPKQAILSPPPSQALPLAVSQSKIGESTFVIFIEEKPYAEGSLKLTGFLRPEDNEPELPLFSSHVCN